MYNRNSDLFDGILNKLKIIDDSMSKLNSHNRNTSNRNSTNIRNSTNKKKVDSSQSISSQFVSYILNNPIPIPNRQQISSANAVSIAPPPAPPPAPPLVSIAPPPPPAPSNLEQNNMTDDERKEKKLQEQLKLLEAKSLYNKISECNICMEDKYVIKCARCTLLTCSLCIATQVNELKNKSLKCEYLCPGGCGLQTTIENINNEINTICERENKVIYKDIYNIMNMIEYAKYYNAIKYSNFTHCYLQTKNNTKNIKKSINEFYTNDINKLNDIIIGFYGIYYNDIEKHCLNDGYLSICIKSNKYAQINNVNFTISIANNNIERQQKLYESLCDIVDNIYTNGYNSYLSNRLNNLILEYS